MKKLLMGLGLAVVAAGCVSVNKNTGDNADLKQWIIKDVMHETYSVEQQRVKGANKVYCLFGFICWGNYEGIADQSDAGFFGAEAICKNGAYAKACDDAKCDQLAAARYKVRTEDYFVFKKVEAEVCGNPVKVTGVEVLENKTFKQVPPMESSVTSGSQSPLGLFKSALSNF